VKEFNMCKSTAETRLVESLLSALRSSILVWWVAV